MEPMLLLVIMVIVTSLIAAITMIIGKVIDRMCRHEYETVDEYTVMPPGEVTEETIPCGKVLVLRCKKCGNVITKKLSV